MIREWARCSNLYVRLFADCIPVKGASRSAICDLTRHEVILFPTEYYGILEYLLRDTVGVLLEKLASEQDKSLVTHFIDFLDENELVLFTPRPSDFPPIAGDWDFPGEVQNAIIDVTGVIHDFATIFDQLDILGCQHVQIRGFSNLLTLNACDQLLGSARHKSIQSVELILAHEQHLSDAVYVKFMEDQPLVVGLTIHSSPVDKRLAVDYARPDELDAEVIKEVRFTSQVIGSEAHCGIIAPKYLTAPSVSSFNEARLYNGCLNRKISVDSAGNIRNCPSLRDSYGNIGDTSLMVAVSAPGFKDKWAIRKDQIDICRDCEFRYVCSDCRAYLERPNDIFSKPLKCGYDPYTGVWAEWSANPVKAQAIKFYKSETAKNFT